jgi:hypothetical protein
MFLDPRLFGNSFNKCRPWRALLRIFCGHDLAMAVDTLKFPLNDGEHGAENKHNVRGKQTRLPPS